MAFLVWTEKFSVAVMELDNHHQRLFMLVNEWQEAMNHETNSEDILNAYEQLIKYSRYHFSAEEEYLICNNYPHYREHKKLHDGFLERLMEIYIPLHQEEKPLLSEVFYFVREWLLNHTLIVDQKYRCYLDLLKIR